MVIDEEPELFSLINNYNHSGTLLTLRNEVVQFMRSKRSQSPSPDGEVSSGSATSGSRRKKPSFSLKVTIPPKNIQRIEGRGL